MTRFEIKRAWSTWRYAAQVLRVSWCFVENTDRIAYSVQFLLQDRGIKVRFHCGPEMHFFTSHPEWPRTHSALYSVDSVSVPCGAGQLGLQFSVDVHLMSTLRILGLKPLLPSAFSWTDVWLTARALPVGAHICKCMPFYFKYEHSTGSRNFNVSKYLYSNFVTTPVKCLMYVSYS